MLSDEVPDEVEDDVLSDEDADSDDVSFSPDPPEFDGCLDTVPSDEVSVDDEKRLL